MDAAAPWILRSERRPWHPPGRIASIRAWATRRPAPWPPLPPRPVPRAAAGSACAT